MIDFQSGYILRPVNPVFIYFSLFCALMLNLLPIGNYGWVPDWLILCIVFLEYSSAPLCRRCMGLLIRPANGCT